MKSIRKSATGVDIAQIDDIEAAPPRTKPCPWCKSAEALIARYSMMPKPDQLARVFVHCGKIDGGPGCGASGPWRLNPIVLKNPDNVDEVLAYFKSMAQVAWFDWNKQ